jgi:tetratricopeptide (TPR) repeat protein
MLAILALGSYREAAIWRDGVTLFRVWTERFPASPIGHSRLGGELLARGEAATAIPALRRALALYSGDLDARQNLAAALLAASSDAAAAEEARDLSTATVALWPEFVPARLTLAQASLRLERPREAAAEAREALRLAPGYPPARALLAEALFRQAEFPQAAREFGELAELDPSDAELRSGLIVSLLRAGDLTAARRAAERARDEFPEVAWFDFCLARVEARSGRREEALALLRAARDRDGATLEWVRRVDDFDLYAGELRAEGLPEAGASAADGGSE